MKLSEITSQDRELTNEEIAEITAWIKANINPGIFTIEELAGKLLREMEVVNDKIVLTDCTYGTCIIRPKNNIWTPPPFLFQDIDTRLYGVNIDDVEFDWLISATNLGLNGELDGSIGHIVDRIAELQNKVKGTLYITSLDSRDQQNLLPLVDTTMQVKVLLHRAVRGTASPLQIIINNAEGRANSVSDDSFLTRSTYENEFELQEIMIDKGYSDWV